jgi:formylglycine-generating enzyme required for sulfatase activity
MAGNVFEWTSTLYNSYPYRVDDGREDLNSRNVRILKGGSWRASGKWVRCACRDGGDPWFRNNIGGFRLARTLS